MTVEPNKSHVHKTCSQPIITLLFPHCSPAFSKTSPLPLPQVPDGIRSTLDTPKGSKVMVNGQDPKILCSQRSNCEKLTVKILTMVTVVTTGHMGVTPPLLFVDHPLSQLTQLNCQLNTPYLTLAVVCTPLATSLPTVTNLQMFNS